jgi:hypothetical protein
VTRFCTVFHPSPSLLRVLLALLCAFPGWLAAQTVREEPTPYSAWLDFNRLAANHWPRTGLPPWLESISADATMIGDRIVSTTYRLRFQEIRNLNKEMQLRLFFDDQKDAAPRISGWTETGTLCFERAPVALGLGLPTSESMTFATEGVDLVEIVVPGDGRTVRGVFLAMAKTEEMQRALDFAPATTQLDPFGNVPPAAPKPDDLTLYGRVRARIDSGLVKLVPPVFTAAWEFTLESPPLLAVVTFEVLGADALAPLEVIVNDRPVGPAAMHLPDLADPSYLGLVRPLERDMRFRYTGWLRGQKAIPGSALQAGQNRVTIQLHPESGPVAIRSVELQLKYNWKNLDYTLAPTRP